MSSEDPQPTELDDTHLEQATGGLVSAAVTYKSVNPVAKALALNRNGGGGGGVSFGSLDTGVDLDRDEPDLL